MAVYPLRAHPTPHDRQPGNCGVPRGVHGCIVEDDCLIGRGALVLNGASIGRGSSVEAGAVVTEGAQVLPQSLVIGLPSKITLKACRGRKGLQS